MAYANRYTGKDLVVIWLPEGLTAPAGNITLTGDQTSFDYSFKSDTVDVTAASELDRSYIPTLKSLEFKLSIFSTNTYSASTSVKAGDKGKMSVHPVGVAVAAGKTNGSFNAIIDSNDETFPFDGAVEIEIAGRRNGGFINPFGTLNT